MKKYFKFAFVFVLFSVNINAQKIKKSHLRTLERKAELIQLKPIDKSLKIYIGDITTNKGTDKARVKEEFMKYFGINGFKLTSKRDEAFVIIEGGYSHDLIAPGQILGFDISITDNEGLLIASYSKRSNSFVGPTFDSAIAQYLINNLRLEE